ncbi:VIER F-box protein 2, partial [Tanacetum coccineum]
LFCFLLSYDHVQHAQQYPINPAKVSGNASNGMLQGACVAFLELPEIGLLAPSHGISIGILMKANIVACVSNITISNEKIHDPMIGVRIKTWQIVLGYDIVGVVVEVRKQVKGTIGLVKDVPLTCDAPLEVFNNEVSRLSEMDDDLFTYEVEVANIPCDSKMYNNLEQEADDDMGYDPSDVAFIEWLGSKFFNYKTMDHYTMKTLWIYWIRGDDEVELTDEESSDDMDEVAETYKDYMNDWIYERNKDVPWVDERPWTNAEVWTKPTLVKTTCNLANYKTGCSEWPTCSWRDDGYYLLSLSPNDSHPGFTANEELYEDALSISVGSGAGHVWHVSVPLSSGPAPQLMTPETLSSGLVPNPPLPTPYVPPTKKDWDTLFQLMFDEYFNPLPSVASTVPVAVAPVPANSTGSPSSTLVDEDAQSPSTLQTPQASQSQLLLLVL